MKETRMLRRLGNLRLLAVSGGVVAALALAACGSDNKSASTTAPAAADSGAASAPKGAKVGYISFAPVAASDWERAHWSALETAAKKYNLTVSNQEGVTFDEATQVLSRMAPNSDVVIADSSGYEAAMNEVAPKFPKTKFIIVDHLAAASTNPNMAGWSINWNELGYLGGTAACLAAKDASKDTVGHVSAQPISALTHFAGGIQDGAKASGCKFTHSWTNSFTDTAAGKQAALTLIGKGAGAITSLADAGDKGSQSAANSKNTAFIGLYTPLENTTTSLVIDFERAYDEVGQAVTGDFKSELHHMDIASGFLSYATPFADPGAAVEGDATGVLAKIKSGETKVSDKTEVKP
jgi:basic membrane protein A